MIVIAVIGASPGKSAFVLSVVYQQARAGEPYEYTLNRRRINPNFELGHGI